MKCFVFFFISLGLAMAFPQPPYRDAEEVENQMTEPELKEPGRRTYMSFGNTAGSVGQQGTNSGNVAVGHQFNGGYYGRRELELKEPGRRTYMSFGNTAGSVGQQGTNSGNVAVGHEFYYGRREPELKEPGRRGYYFGETGGNVGQQGVAVVGSPQHNGRR